MKARSSPVCACLSSVLRSAPAIKIDFFADVTITPRTDGSFSIASRCSLRFCMVGASKIFAPDSGRSKVSTQIPSSPISRRIIGAVTVAVIGLILASFFEIPSGMRMKFEGERTCHPELRRQRGTSQLQCRFACALQRRRHERSEPRGSVQPLRMRGPSASARLGMTGNDAPRPLPVSDCASRRRVLQSSAARS